MTWRRLWAPEVRDPTPAGDRLREEIAATADLFHRRVHEMLGVELGYSYAGSELIAGDGGPEDWDVQRYEAHTRPGIRLPHVWLADGTAVQDVMGPDYTLLDLTGAADMREISAAFASLGVPLTLVQRDEPHAREVYGAPALLMRPDLHIFWRGEQVPSDPNVVLRLAVRASGQIVGATSIGAAR